MELGELSGEIVQGNAAAAEKRTREALSEGMDPLVILNQGLVAGMNAVGDKFRNGEYFIPQVLLSARAMKTCVAFLRPHLARREGAGARCVVIGTVQGDLHDIGKNLVAMMLEGAGFDVVDLGSDVAPPTITLTSCPIAESFRKSIVVFIAGLVVVSRADMQSIRASWLCTA